MACNHARPLPPPQLPLPSAPPPPHPHPFGRDDLVRPVPPSTPVREDNWSSTDAIDSDSEEEFTFPPLQEVFVDHFFFPIFRVGAVVDFDEESVGDISLNDISDDEQPSEDENGKKPPGREARV